MNSVLNQENIFDQYESNCKGGQKRKTLPLTEEWSCVVMDKFVGATENALSLVAD